MPESNDPKYVTESLYKQNLELAVKNKTLSLLGKLYEISILALEPKELGEKVSEAIQADFSFELVGILLYNKEQDVLSPLSFAESRRFHEVQSKSGVFFKDISISKIRENSFFGPIIKEKGMAYTENTEDIWGSLVSVDIYNQIKTFGHVVSSLVHPLMIGPNLIGVLILALNRDYNHLVEYEKESIKSFVNVIAVALDKAILLQELHITNDKLASANEKLKELDQLKSEFLSLASHQIRAPLTAIKGYASMILQGDFGQVPGKAKEAVEIVMKSTVNLINIVEDFLNVSRIEQGRMAYNKEKFDLRDLVKEVVAELSPNVQKAGLSIEAHLSERDGNTWSVNADKGKIKQILENLIDNAIKYTLKGGIDVSLEESKDKIIVRVKDTGIGIAEEDIKKLFAKFSRTKDAHKTNVSGTGLGLYVAKNMLEAQGGTISMESGGPGKGSTFSIVLPRAL